MEIDEMMKNIKIPENVLVNKCMNYDEETGKCFDSNEQCRMCYTQEVVK